MIASSVIMVFSADNVSSELLTLHTMLYLCTPRLCKTCLKTPSVFSSSKISLGQIAFTNRRLDGDRCLHTRMVARPMAQMHLNFQRNSGQKAEYAEANNGIFVSVDSIDP